MAQNNVVWHDDFAGGFDAAEGTGRWKFVEGGGHRADDGAVSTSPDGLRVASRGAGPDGAPAFIQTIPNEADDPKGVPGTGDHAKWIVYANHLADTGLQGFDARPGRVLTVGAVLGGRTHNTAAHPFGDAVADPEDDPRLAAAMLNTIDPETSVAFDFLVTNKTLYAFYGRTNFARRRLGDYASFAHTIPLASRSPADRHTVFVAYDPEDGTARWFVEGAEVLRVDRIGHRLDRSTLTLDEGGEEAEVRPRQLSAGMGMLTLLDGSWPTGRGLVRLSSRANYYAPEHGGPKAQSFVDEVSRDASRLFGQGAELSIANYTVRSLERGTSLTAQPE
jgi:hypothetical protein